MCLLILRFVLLSTRSRVRGLGVKFSPLRPHVEGVPKAVSEQVERECGDDQERAGEEHQPPGDVVQLPRRRSGSSPTRPGRPGRRGRGTRARPRRGCSSGSAASSRRSAARSGSGGSPVARMRMLLGAGGARGLDELLLAQRQRVAAHDARDVRPREDRDHRDHDRDPRLDEPAEAAVLRRSSTPRRCRPRSGSAAPRAARRRRARGSCRRSRRRSRRSARRSSPISTAKPGRDDADEERRARAVHRAHEQVAARGVGAEPELAVRPVRHAVGVGHLAVRRVLRVAGDLLRRAARRRSRSGRAGRSRRRPRARPCPGGSAPRRAARGSCGRSTTGGSASAPPEDTSKSGGFVIPRNEA